MKLHFPRNLSIFALGLGLAASASAADIVVTADSDLIATPVKAVRLAKKPGNRHTLKRLTTATSALRQMAKSLDEVESAVDKRFVRLAAAQASLQTINN